MSTEKRDPNATIQIDQLSGLDDVILEDAPQKARTAPPPIPAELLARASGAPAKPSAAPAKPSAGKTIALAALFVVLLVAAIVGGLSVGGLARKPAPAASATAPGATAPAASAPAPSAPAGSGNLLVIPETEIVSP